MTVDKPPVEVNIRFRRRNQFTLNVVLILTIMAAAAWWILPSMTKLPPDMPTKIEGAAKFAIAAATWFRVFWLVCLVAGAGLVFLARRGVLDPLLPLLNLLLLVTGVGVVALCLFSRYAVLASIQL